MEEWLSEEDGRTLIYVGRDFDALPDYWRSMEPQAPAEQYMEVRRRYARARVNHEVARSGFADTEDCRWFAVDRTGPPHRVRSLQGQWRRGIDAEKTQINLGTRIEPSKETRESTDRSSMEPLLRSGSDMIAGKLNKRAWKNSSIIVIANGSWLLNESLVNHEHRKLAGRLIEECGEFEEVTFLMSGAAGPIISSLEPNRHHGLEAFTVEPVNYILIHLFVLGIVYAFFAFPIFGRPRVIDDGTTSDFSRHIRSLGNLLSLTHDREYARQQRETYHQRVTGEKISQPAVMASMVADTNPVAARPVGEAAGDKGQERVGEPESRTGP